MVRIGVFLSLSLGMVKFTVHSIKDDVWSSLTFDSLLPSVSGVVYGADDFLPCLTWVLLRGDVVALQLDTDYIMELLDPTQLQGEGTNYTNVSRRPTKKGQHL